jgi:hypothetical protein
VESLPEGLEPGASSCRTARFQKADPRDSLRLLRGGRKTMSKE